MVFTSSLGYFLCLFLGFSKIVSLYISVALTFSSTIIIMKLLSDKDSLEKLYGKISIGFLLVQDLAAILILIVVSSLSNGFSGGSLIFSTVFKGILLFAILYPIGHFVLPRFTNFFAKSQEFLFIFAVSFGFGLSLLFLYAGFSLEVGALFAGIMLSMSSYSFEISSKLKPLRDFFIISFFIVLGSRMVFSDISNLILPAIILSLFILIGNPIVVMALMGLLGYSKKTGFMAGLTVAQISEFSLILISFGVSSGKLSGQILSFVTIIGLFTIAGSTYMIIYSEKIFKFLENFLSIFERKKIKEKEILRKKYDYVLLGYNRIGFSIVKSFSKITKRFLVVDYNPEVVRDLKLEGINAVYGDVEDSEFLEDLEIFKAKVIVSTVPEKETNSLILDVLKRNKSKAITILTGRQIQDAFDLYASGANYVILPHFLGGEYTADLILKAKSNLKVYDKACRTELKILRERLKKGQQHPKVEKER